MNIINLEVKNRKDYLSVDNLTAISSHGIIFNINDKITHSGDDENLIGKIQAFMLNRETNDVQAIVELENGWEVRGRISFLDHIIDKNE